jgi:hypothetical protein
MSGRTTGRGENLAVELEGEGPMGMVGHSWVPSQSASGAHRPPFPNSQILTYQIDNWERI